MLKVLKPGIYSTVQDLGRYGYAASGVPVSGAMDHYSVKVANLLLQNDKNDAVLEVTFNGEFQFLKETVFSISGADLNAELNNKPILSNHPIKANANSILKFKSPKYGIRAYIAVKGGFLNKPVLGSRSLFKEVTKKYRLQKDDEIFYEPFSTLSKQSLSTVKVVEEHFTTTEIEVYQGPEYNLLTNEQKQFLKTNSFTISNENSRMGYRLQELMPNKSKTILTSAVMPGTVQLTPSGKLIVLMRDCGVTGGYPRILQLTAKAINRLAQKTTNNAFQFMQISLAQ